MNNKVQQKENLEMTLVQDYSHSYIAMGGMCPCKRCQTISYLFTLRKVAKSELLNKYSDRCLKVTYLETNSVNGKLVESVKTEHNKKDCRFAPGTACSELRHFKNSWFVYLANHDIEAFAWRRIADDKLNRDSKPGRATYELVGSEIVMTKIDKETGQEYTTTKSIESYVAKEIKIITSKLSRLLASDNEDSVYLKSYSTQSDKWVVTSPFAKLLVTLK